MRQQLQLWIYCLWRQLVSGDSLVHTYIHIYTNINAYMQAHELCNVARCTAPTCWLPIDIVVIVDVLSFQASALGKQVCPAWQILKRRLLQANKSQTTFKCRMPTIGASNTITRATTTMRLQREKLFNSNIPWTAVGNKNKNK